MYVLCFHKDLSKMCFLDFVIYARKKRTMSLIINAVMFFSSILVLYLDYFVITKVFFKSSTTVPSRARVYTDVLSQKPWDYSYYEGDKLVWRNLDEFQILDKLGQGHYGEVFEARNIRSDEKCVLKILKPTVTTKRIQRELKILNNLKKGTNIIKLMSIAKEKNALSHRRAFVFELVQDIDHTKLFDILRDDDIRFYMFELLKALDYTHSMGIMHRDVKLENVVIDHKKRKLRLIDWGLADFYRPGREYSTNVSTKPYRGPELLLNYEMYDYSLDMWSFGCTLATLIFRRALFVGGSDVELLVNIAKVLGTEDLFKYLDKYKINLDGEMKHIKNSCYPHARWEGFESSKNRHLVSPAALDLLDHILCYDHAHRYTAREAMAHPYFYVVRSSFGYQDYINDFTNQKFLT